MVRFSGVFLPLLGVSQRVLFMLFCEISFCIIFLNDENTQSLAIALLAERWTELDTIDKHQSLVQFRVARLLMTFLFYPKTIPFIGETCFRFCW